MACQRLSPAEQALYELLEDAARDGLPCPTNREIFEHANISSSDVSRVLRTMQEKGAIAVDASANARVVTIVATGHRTAPTAYSGSASARYQEDKRVGTERAIRNLERKAKIETPAENISCFLCGSRADACGCKQMVRRF